MYITSHVTQVRIAGSFTVQRTNRWGPQPLLWVLSHCVIISDPCSPCSFGLSTEYTLVVQTPTYVLHFSVLANDGDISRCVSVAITLHYISYHKQICELYEYLSKLMMRNV